MEWVNAVVQGILLGGFYALLATGLSLVFGVMRLVNLAQGDLTVLAAYLSLTLIEATGIGPFASLIVVTPGDDGRGLRAPAWHSESHPGNGRCRPSW